MRNPLRIDYGAGYRWWTVGAGLERSAVMGDLSWFVKLGPATLLWTSFLGLELCLANRSSLRLLRVEPAGPR